MFGKIEAISCNDNDNTRKSKAVRLRKSNYWKYFQPTLENSNRVRLRQAIITNHSITLLKHTQKRSGTHPLILIYRTTIRHMSLDLKYLFGLHFFTRAICQQKNPAS